MRKIPSERLGSGGEDANEIKRQPFFEKIDWEKLDARKIPPPWKPSVSGPTDLHYIDKMFTEDKVSSSLQKSSLDGETNKFPEFTYVGREYL